MKHTTYILTFLILTSCGQSSSNTISKQEISSGKDTVKKDSKSDTIKTVYSLQTDNNNQDLSDEFKNVKTFKLTDTIAADFNGDGKIDRAVFKKGIETSGIIITHGETNAEIKIGFGTRLAHLTEFNWVDFWGLIYDLQTYEIVIEDGEIIDDREVILENPSIIVRKEEVGGGLITFKNGRYVWVHQAH